MDNSHLRLKLPSNQAVVGPNFRKEGSQFVVEYDYERDDGTIEWAQIKFEEVLELEYCQNACCDADDILEPQEMRCLKVSPRLTEVLARWQQYLVGSEEWQKRQGGIARFKHFTLYFDDMGCINVIAASCIIDQ